jgi:hypothetical protein
MPIPLGHYGFVFITVTVPSELLLTNHLFAFNSV